MKEATPKLLLWTPRVLGILLALFLGLFALDAFNDSRGFWRSVPAFLVHLAPAAIALGVVYVAWNRPWFGALMFLLLAAGYVITTLERPTWILAIAGPLTLVGLAYATSWWLNNATHIEPPRSSSDPS